MISGRQAEIVSRGSDGERYAVRLNGGPTLIESVALDWESNFFRRSMRRLDIVAPVSAASLPEWLKAVELALADHDMRRTAITQVNLDLGSFEIMSCLEGQGFVSVDTRAEFMTRVSPPHIPDMSPPFGEIVDLDTHHIEDVLELVQAGFVENSQFQSRFKNRTWFTDDDTKRYYVAWIRNIVGTEGALGAIWEYEQETLGFFLYQRSGEKDGVPIYKGILAAVLPEYRGHSAHLILQSNLYSRMPETVWLDNTTQLTNIPVIRNHMESSKHLESLSIVLYRSGAEAS